jgi:predicted permease
MRDLRLALRALRRSPTFATVAVLSLAAGIGANVTVFSVVDALLLRPLPVANADHLVRIGRTTRDAYFATVSYPEFGELRAMLAPVLDLAGHYPNSATLTVEGEPKTAWLELVSANYFTMLGVRPLLGRAFLPNEDNVSAASAVIVLSHRVWRSRFGGDSGVIGRTAKINGRPFAIIGVAPPGFRGTFTGFDIDLWVPASMQPVAVPSAGTIANREDRFLMMIGRLQRGASVAQVQAALAVAAPRLRAAQLDTKQVVRLDVTAATGVHPFIAGIVKGFLGLLQAIVALVLLVACANLANLLLVRASARAREISVRRALGATRWRIATLFLAESAVIAALGGALGLALALGAGWAIERAPLDIGIPVGLTFGLDVRILALALGATVVTTFAFGTGPALTAARLGTLGLIRSGASSTDWRRSRVRRALVGLQVAASTVLLVGGSLMLRSLQRSASLDPGFDATNVQLFSASPDQLGYDEARGRALWETIAARARQVSGVRSAALALLVPLGNRGDLLSSGPVGSTRPPELLPYNYVDSSYFSTLRIPVVAGRVFGRADVYGAADVAIVSTTMARRFFGQASAIGRAVRVVDRAGRERRATVVGVVGDVKLRTMGEPPRPVLYLPFGQWYRPDMVLHVRSDGRAPNVGRDIVRAIRIIEPDLAVDAQSMAHATAFALIPVQVAATVLGFAGAVGLILAGLGVFGLVAYAVSLRTREIGIRMALGAQPAALARFVAGEGMKPVLIGLAIGLPAAIGAGSLLRGILIGVGPADPVVLLLVAAILFASAAAAMVAPVRRALRLDPATVLRQE